MERTLIIIKPDAVERNLTGEIFSELDFIGKRIATINLKASMNKILEHYADSIKKHGEILRNKLFAFDEKKIILALYEGEDVIAKMKEKIGATDPIKSADGTIRKKFGDDSLDIAMKEVRMVRNLVHASGSKEEFEKEFKVWKEFFN